MTFLARKILAPHMHIMGHGGVFHGMVQVPVLDRIAAAPKPVAGPAVGPGGRPHMLSDLQKIQTGRFLSASGRDLAIGAGLVVADEAVDPGSIRKVK